MTDEEASPFRNVPAVERELFTRRFTAIAEEMGETLQRTALSVNVKERLDFSCALLGPAGELVATAAHIPVHLGALGVCVRMLTVAKETVVTNHPAFGGSHLPDVTLVTPGWDGEDLLGYVASRAHHAEIGGRTPGSMPPNATTLAEEGVVIPPIELTANGIPQWERVVRLLTDAPYPTRALSDNRADLEAMFAANTQGAHALRALARRYGTETLAHYRHALAEQAERLAREAIARALTEQRTVTGQLDDGSPIVITLRPENGGLTVDFTGTGQTHPGNLNAPPAVVTACVLYVLRTLMGTQEELPLNEGVLRAVALHLPEGTLVNPHFTADPTRCPAVVGGNTEVSQRISTLLLRAFGVTADAQTTMNNILFGNKRFGYYETVCGGAGATPHAPGASAVHTHMTNTRLTDPEILERRYPVRVGRFAIRHGSGGVGKHPGGDGVVRELTFTEPVTLSVLTQSRTQAPLGMAGGEAGAAGRQYVLRTDGTQHDLASVDGCVCAAGDTFVLETPGGGAWG